MLGTVGVAFDSRDSVRDVVHRVTSDQRPDLVGVDLLADETPSRRTVSFSEGVANEGTQW